MLVVLVLVVLAPAERVYVDEGIPGYCTSDFLTHYMAFRHEPPRGYCIDATVSRRRMVCYIFPSFPTCRL